MRRIASLLLFAPVLVLSTQGCLLDLCVDYPGACGPGSQGGGGEGGATTSSGTSGGGMGGDGGGGGGVVDPACDPRMLTPGTPIGEDCGVFVEVRAVGAGAPQSSGTKAAPFRDFASAFVEPLAPGKAIYVCANGAGIDASREITRSVGIFGGFVDCTTWAVPAADATERTAWTAGENEIPALIRGTSAVDIDVTFWRFDIVAKDADGHDATTLQGRSSVGVWAERADVTLVESSVTAGAGAPGGDANDPATQAAGAQSDPGGFDGNDGRGCGMPGGEQKSATCSNETPGTSIGGRGGEGATDTGGDGLSGSPSVSGTPAGEQGRGEPETEAWSCGGGMNILKGSGGNGAPGPAGNDGPGGSTLGSLASPDSTGVVHIGASGEAGTIGRRGQGGGGGGGRKANAAIAGCSVAGPSGGSGGAGGCGGLGGRGGGAGGSSIGVVLFDASLALSTSTIASATGGTGGKGGRGQLGGLGGEGGAGGQTGRSPNPVIVACKGGDGGEGGRGGHGGGGRGGASIGVAYVGASPSDTLEDAITIATAAAPGGLGGNDSMVNAGASGVRQKIQGFPAQ